MKFALSIFLVFCFFTAVTQQKKITPAQSKDNTNDTLHWSKDRKLTWDDFQGMPDTNSINGAITHSGIFYYSAYTKKDTSITITVTSVFDKKKSWVKMEVLDPYSLNHEQGHFNITEVYARKLRRIFKNYKFSLATVNSDIKVIYDSVNKDLRKVQLLYDKETTYPKIRPAKQKEWDKKIAVWLKKYESE